MPLSFPEPSPDKVNWLTKTAIAHRGLHDREAGTFENTLSAAKRAVEHGFAIEIDLHPSQDGVPMVFHDHTLERLCGDGRNIRDLNAHELSKISIGDTKDTIPTLEQLLETVSGKVGIVLELKGQFGADDGFVEAVGNVLAAYTGKVAIMSFYHHLLRDARAAAPDLALGLTAEGDDSRYESHKLIAEQTNVDFLSYENKNLNSRFVDDFRQSGRPVICWTIRSKSEAAESAAFSDQITFEGFMP